MKLTNSILVGADIAPPGGFFFDPLPEAMPKDEQYSYRDLGPSGVALNCVARPDRSRHYLSYDDVLRINDKSSIRLTWCAVDRHWTVRAWTHDLDEIGGNVKGIIHDVQLIRHFNPAIKGGRREDGETHDLWQGYLREFGRP